jgi:hypothetical protein
MNITGFHIEEGELEEWLWTLELLIAYGDHLMVRQLVALLQGEWRCLSGNLLLKVQGSVAQVPLDVMHHLPLGHSGKSVLFTGQDIYEVFLSVLDNQVQTMAWGEGYAS